MLAPGDKAPDFILHDQADARIRLSAYHGKPVVLFFYPKDNSRGCTRQAKSMRDSYAEFRQLGAAILGISRDDAETHTAFRKEHGLQYPLLTDPGGSIAAEYGVPRTLGLIPGRATFVIDSSGVIRMAHNSMLDTESHVTKALEAVRELQGGAQEGGGR